MFLRVGIENNNDSRPAHALSRSGAAFADMRPGLEYSMTSEKLGEELIKEGSPKITEKDVVKVVDKSEEIQKKFSSRGPLQRFIEDGKLLIAVVKDYWTGKYRKLPWGTVAAIVFTLIYVLDPLDLVPDVLPIIGEVDDAAVFAACLFLVERDLLAYRQWKQGG